MKKGEFDGLLVNYVRKFGSPVHLYYCIVFDDRMDDTFFRLGNSFLMNNKTFNASFLVWP